MRYILLCYDTKFLLFTIKLLIAFCAIMDNRFNMNDSKINQPVTSNVSIKSWEQGVAQILPVDFIFDLTEKRKQIIKIINNNDKNPTYRLVIKSQRFNERNKAETDVWRVAMYLLGENKKEINLLLPKPVIDGDILQREMGISDFYPYPLSREVEGEKFAYNPAFPEQVFIGYSLNTTRVIKVSNFYCVLSPLEYALSKNNPRKFEFLKLRISLTNTTPILR